jgi:Rv3651-like, middle domain/Rv3651-like, C-terminal domain/Rv3651-like, N-terminal
MSHDWLLVETLGSQPVVVADGRQTKKLLPISVFLRRSPDLMAIQTAISETVRAREAMSTITPRNDRVIRTEPVVMSDGCLHGVHVWVAPLGMEPPERPIPGPLKWDLTEGVATDTPESIVNSGRDPSTEATHGRTFAEDLPMRALNASETKVLSMAIKGEPGMTMCSTWTVTDYKGETIAVGFVARANPETQDDGSERLICRAMNWRADPEGSSLPPDHLAQRIVDGLARPGVHRALVDPVNWTLLKWLDEPAPFFDWRAREAGRPSVNPADAKHMARMTLEFANGATSGVLRLQANDDGWTPVHMTINRIELEPGTFAALMALRLPTEAELEVVEFDDDEDAAPDETRKGKRRKKDKKKTKRKKGDGD